MAAGDNVAFTATGVTPAVDGFEQASGDARQAFVVGDKTATNTAAVDALSRLSVNISGSQGSNPQVTGSLTAAGAANLSGTSSTTGSVVVDVAAAGNISFHLLATAFVGTVVFEQSFDPTGSAGTWQAVPILPEDALSPPMSTLAISTAVAYIRQFTGGMFGPRWFRVRASVFTSGSLAVLASAGPGWTEPQPALAPSDSVIGRVSLVSGTTPALTTVNTAAANTNSVLLAADATRKALLIWYRGTGTLSLGFGVATTTTLYSVQVPSGQGYEVPPQWAPFALNGMSTTATQPVNLTAVT